MTYQEFLRNRFNKASDLLLFLVDVIENPPSNFEWDMYSFGNEKIVRGRFVCVGCAATCAVLKLAGIENTQELELIGFAYEDGASMGCVRSRTKILNLPVVSQISLESLFDSLRKGFLGDLRELMKVNLPAAEPNWYFNNVNRGRWVDEISRLKTYIEKIKALGF